MLDDIRDVTKMVTKWLSVPVATFLDAGCLRITPNQKALL
jgi:hypothetical protein